MIIALGFLLPLILYILLRRVFADTRLGLSSFIAAILVALISSGAIIGIIFSSAHWPEGTQIAWTGIEATRKPLAIGGLREEAVISWPNGASAPLLKITPVDDKSAKLAIERGSAFVLDEAQNVILNGVPVPFGESSRFGRYTIRVSSSFPRLWRQKIEILSDTGESLVSFTVPYRFVQKARVYALDALVERSTLNINYDAEGFLKIEALKDWAAGIRLYLSANGEMRILDIDGKWESPCELPCRLSILWPTLRLPVEIRRSGEKLTLEFEPPWRLASPLPPIQGNQAAATFKITERAVENLKLEGLSEDVLRKVKGLVNQKATDEEAFFNLLKATLGEEQALRYKPLILPYARETWLIATGQPMPGDYAFLLPIGHGITDPRRDPSARLTLVKRVNAPPVFSSPGSVTEDETLDDILPRQPKRKDQPKVEQEVGVTSRTSVHSDLYTFLFATVNDLPGLRLILRLTLVALACFIVGLAIAYPRMPDATTRWVVYGLAAALWNLLAFRLLLAIRYALAPDYLDALAVNGVTVAFVGLAAAPGFLLLIARIRSDFHHVSLMTASARKQTFLFNLGYLAMLAIAFFMEYRITPHLWANLPPRFIPSLGLFLTLLLGAVFLYLASSLLTLYGLPPGDSRFQLLPKLFLRPWTFLEKFAAKSATHRWRSIVEGSRMSRVMPMALLALALIAFFALPLLLGLVPISGLDAILKEIIIPIIFCWLPALFWLSSKLYFGQLRKPRRLPRGRVLLAAISTILFPIFLLPLAILVPAASWSL